MSSRPKIALSLLLAFCPLAGRADVGVGDVFPALPDAGLSGGELPPLANKVVVVDFWASWCAPCRASFPVFAKLHGDYGPRGVVIVAIGVDEKTAAYASFIRKHQPPFAVVHDHARKLVSAVHVPAMPSSYLLDRHGRVRFVHRGFHGQATELEMRRQIEMLLAEKD